MWCEGYIELDLGVREQVLVSCDAPILFAVLQLSLLLECRITQISQRVVAEILIVLSVKEPGENWQVTLFIISFRQTSLAITSTSFD
jgi:hypothetical protein